MYVVTSPELGWDCVVGVYSLSVNQDKLRRVFPEPQYVITECDVESDQTLDEMLAERYDF